MHSSSSTSEHMGSRSTVGTGTSQQGGLGQPGPRTSEHMGSRRVAGTGTSRWSGAVWARTVQVPHLSTRTPAARRAPELPGKAVWGRLGLAQFEFHIRAHSSHRLTSPAWSTSCLSGSRCIQQGELLSRGGCVEDATTQRGQKLWSARRRNSKERRGNQPSGYTVPGHSRGGRVGPGTGLCRHTSEILSHGSVSAALATTTGATLLVFSFYLKGKPPT